MMGPTVNTTPLKGGQALRGTASGYRMGFLFPGRGEWAQSAK